MKKKKYKYDDIFTIYLFIILWIYVIYINNNFKDETTVTDDTRLRAIVPTTKFLLDKGANVILMSHFGRPKGEIIETGKNGRLTPIVKPLEELLGTSITKVDTTVGKEAEDAANKLRRGDVVLLENTRFDIGETKNDTILAEGMGKLADYFVMDAFGTAHRAHSSTAGVTQFMKASAAGFLLDKELEYLQGAVNDPKRPMMAIVGGAKVCIFLQLSSNKRVLRAVKLVAT